MWTFFAGIGVWFRQRKETRIVLKQIGENQTVGNDNFDKKIKELHPGSVTYVTCSSWKGTISSEKACLPIIIFQGGGVKIQECKPYLMWNTTSSSVELILYCREIFEGKWNILRIFFFIKHTIHLSHSPRSTEEYPHSLISSTFASYSHRDQCMV